MLNCCIIWRHARLNTEIGVSDMGLSERLRELIDETGRSDREIAKWAGLSPACLSFLLSGRSKNPSGETLSKLAKILNVTVDDLLHPAVQEEEVLSWRQDTV